MLPPVLLRRFALLYLFSPPLADVTAGVLMRETGLSPGYRVHLRDRRAGTHPRRWGCSNLRVFWVNRAGVCDQAVAIGSPPGRGFSRFAGAIAVASSSRVWMLSLRYVLRR
jgi:hypothetical protein